MRMKDFTGEEVRASDSAIAPAQDGDVQPTAGRPQDGPEGEVVGNNWLMPIVLVALLVLLAVKAGLGALAIVGGFLFVIFMHELGHFLTAKSAGMKVTQFFLGLGPTIWSTQRGEVEYGLKALPLGAFVRIVGMNNLDPVDPEDEHRAYRQAPYWRRMSVVLAGSGMHFIMAFIALLGMHSLVGWQGPSEPLVEDPQWNISSVLPDTAAEIIGFEAGDIVLSIDGEAIDSFGGLAGIITDSANQNAEFVVDRAGERVYLSGQVGENIDPMTGEVSGRLGVASGYVFVPPERKGLGDSVVTSAQDFGVLTKDSITGIIGLPRFLLEKIGAVQEAVPVASEGTGSGQGSSDPLSVVGIVRAGDTFVDIAGWSVLGFLFIAINIFLGMFNLVPLLPFDGGHAVIATYERLRSLGGKRHFVDAAKLLPMTYATIIVLVMLMGITVYNDIFNFSLS